MPALLPAAVARPVIAPDAALEAPTRSSAQPLGRLFKAWVRVLPVEASLTFGANSKTGKSAHRFSLYHTAATVNVYRALNPASAFVHEDLAFDLSRGHAQLPPSVWDTRVCDSVVFAGAVGSAPSAVQFESLVAFTVRAALGVHDEFCADALHDRASRLAAVNPSLRVASCGRVQSARRRVALAPACWWCSGAATYPRRFSARCDCWLAACTKTPSRWLRWRWTLCGMRPVAGAKRPLSSSIW